MISWRQGGRGAGAVFGVGLIALTVFAGSANAAFPDLKVTGGEVTGPVDHWIFANTPRRIVWWDNTTNIGSVASPLSYTKLFFSELAANNGSGGVNWSPGSRQVKALKPGESNKGSAESSQGVTVPLPYIGSYYSFECANRPRRFRESDFTNNCTNLNERFKVVPRRWEGTVNGSSTAYDEFTEAWSADVTFVLDSNDPAGSGEFLYRLRTASVQYTASGVDADGCTVSGKSAKFVILDPPTSQSAFSLFNSSNNLSPGHYDGHALLPSEFSYPIYHTCPNPSESWTESGPAIGRDWFDTFGLRRLPSVIGFTHLAATAKHPSLPWTNHWTLDAQ